MITVPLLADLLTKLNKELVKASCLFVFLIFLAFQGTRGVLINTWSVLKDSYHLYSLTISEKKLERENSNLKEKIQEIQNINKTKSSQTKREN